MDKDVEFSAMVNPTTGAVLKRTKGVQFGVTSGLTTAQEKNLVMTHNHPAAPYKHSWGFSNEDIAYAVTNDLASIRAVAREKDGIYVYHFQRPAEGWEKVLEAHDTRTGSVSGYDRIVKANVTRMTSPAFVQEAAALAKTRWDKKADTWLYHYSHAAYDLNAIKSAAEMGATYTRTKIK